MRDLDSFCNAAVSARRDAWSADAAAQQFSAQRAGGRQCEPCILRWPRDECHREFDLTWQQRDQSLEDETDAERRSTRKRERHGPTRQAVEPRRAALVVT